MGTSESAVVLILRNDATVSGLVAARIYPQFVPETGTFPAIMYQLTGKEEIDSSDGIAGTVKAEMDINALAETYAEMIALADAIRDALSTFAGTSDSVVAQRILLRDQFDVPFISPNNDQLRLYGRRMTIEVWNLE